MPILTLGVSFRRAPIELLDRLAFTDDDLAKAYRLAGDLDELAGVVILSTCNRVEVTGDVASYHSGFMALKRLLTQTRGVGIDQLGEPLYSHWEQEAADHLFAVAGGLDSMVLGETQIYAQVREAVRRAEREAGATIALTGLFHAATRAGRRVRQETSLGAAPDAFVSLGADLAAEQLGGLTGRSVVVLGAGQMASLAVKHLRRRDVGPIRILNRSLDRARSLAGRTGAEPDELAALPQALSAADLVVSATGAVGTMIDRAVVVAAMRGRESRLVLLDLAVPRDIDPGVASVDHAQLFDVMALRDRLTGQDQDTARDLAKAQAIVGDEVRRYVLRRRGDALAPLITALRRRGETIVSGELARQASKLDALTPDERAAVEALAHGIAAKLLHDPIVELKERSGPGADGAHARVLAELLGIDPDEP